jgi:hypothetical protein
MLRQLAIDDMDSAAGVLRTSFDAALPTLAGLHTPDQDRWFFRERVFATCQLWGYFDAKELVVPRDNQGETAASIWMRMRRGWTGGARA